MFQSCAEHGSQGCLQVPALNTNLTMIIYRLRRLVHSGSRMFETIYCWHTTTSMCGKKSLRSLAVGCMQI